MGRVDVASHPRACNTIWLEGAAMVDKNASRLLVCNHTSKRLDIPAHPRISKKAGETHSGLDT
jgi:hypothetical protein